MGSRSRPEQRPGKQKRQRQRTCCKLKGELRSPASGAGSAEGAVSAGVLPAAAGSDRRAQEQRRARIWKMHLSRETLPCNHCKGSRHLFYPLPPQHKTIHIKHVPLVPGEGSSVTPALPRPAGVSPASASVTQAAPCQGQRPPAPGCEGKRLPARCLHGSKMRKAPAVLRRDPRHAPRGHWGGSRHPAPAGFAWGQQGCEISAVFSLSPAALPRSQQRSKVTLATDGAIAAESPPGCHGLHTPTSRSQTAGAVSTHGEPLPGRAPALTGPREISSFYFSLSQS